MPMPEDGRPVHIIGGGPGGLATAAALQKRGIRALVVERSDAVGASWRGHYDRLRLHTTRRWSSLPGLPMPRSFGRWVARDDMVRYLEKYAEHHRLEVATGVEVSRIERLAPADGHPDGTAASGGDGGGDARGDGDGHGGWLLRANGGRELHAPVVVVATGYNHTPHLPDWEGRETFTGELLHASRYRNAKPYAGRDVLVVGVGNTGAEIAADLVQGGAGRVRLAVRTPPHILRRSTLGWPSQATGILVRRLPVPVVDRMARVVVGASMPDLSGRGLPRPSQGLYSRVREGAIPVQDVGLVKGVKKGLIEPVPAVAALDGGKVRLADGSLISPEVVIAATGYRRGLEDLAGHLGVLDERGLPRAHGRRAAPGAPGLYFTGYTSPISGMLRELSLDAERIARAVARAAA